MALADFFDKAALAAVELLGGVDYQEVAGRLEAEVVCLSFDRSASGSEGHAAAELLVNLLARLYPRLALAPLDQQAQKVADELAAIASAINPHISLEDVSCATRCLVVGETRVQREAVYIGSDGWLARVQANAPVGSTSSGNPFGALVAACVGAGTVFRDVFAEALPQDQPSGPLVWSLVEEADADLPPLDLGDVHIVGLGAIGNATIWALARTAGIEGTLHLVDAETISLSNLQRYVLPRRSDDERQKVDIGAEALAATRLAAVPHRTKWAEAAAAAEHRLDLVAVAVDSMDGRREVQASLPRDIVNAWTQPGEVGISRHAFLGDDACLMCLYLPSGPRPDEDDLVAAAIGLPDALLEVREMLYTGRPVDRSFLDRLAVARQIPVGSLLSFEGRPLRSFYSEAVCGGLLLRLGSTTVSERDATVPLAHQSALAGVLLGAEIVAKRAGLTTSRATTTRYDILRPFARPVSVPAAKDRSGRCICQDPDYIVAYRAKHGV